MSPHVLTYLSVIVHLTIPTSYSAFGDVSCIPPVD